MNLPRPPKTYTVAYESQRNLLIELDSHGNLKRNRDLEVGDGRLILRSPNGTRYQITVSDAGVLGASAI